MMETRMIARFLVLTLAILLAGAANAADYYVATTGSNGNAGTVGSPWLTIDYAISQAVGGDTIHVADGSYASITETTPSGRTSYLTIKSTNLHGATVSGISVNYGTSLTNSYLNFEDLAVYKVNTNGGVLVIVHDARHVRMTNISVSSSRFAVSSGTPGAPHMTTGMQVYDCEDVVIDGAEVFEVARGGQVQNTGAFVLRNSYIAPKSSTGWQNLTGNTNTLFENNHFHGTDGIPWPDGWQTYPTDPQGPNNDNSHASIISNRSGDVTIRGNHMHGMGNSSGLMWYDRPGNPAYDDVVIENNLLYDTTNVYAIRFYQPGSRIVLRNNLVFSKYRTDVNTCVWILNQALIFHAAPVSPSTLEIHNNIFMGRTSMPAGAQESRNIIWASASTEWSVTSPSGVAGFDGITAGGTLVAKTGGTCGQDHNDVFEVAGEFFASPPDFDFPLPIHANWTFDANSVGINYGNASKQYPVSIGSLDLDGKFLLADGVTRSSTIHSVGPLEGSVADLPTLVAPLIITP